MKHCVFYWNNQAAEGGGSFTLQPGIAPSRGILRFLPSQPISEIGTFRLADNVAVNHPFRNCRMTRYQVTTTDAGRFAEVTFLDRRWKWQNNHYAVHGRYNQIGSLYGERNTKSPYQLAVILCEALGEKRYNVSALPRNIVGPPVEWDGDNPAMELAALAGAFGCIVTLSTDDRLVLYPFGQGRTPRPDSRQMEFTDAMELPAIPQALVFEGGPTSIQWDVPLIPVAKDSGSGQYKYIRDLSYNPTNHGLAGSALSLFPFYTGWEHSRPPHNGVDVRYRALAAEVWHTYAIGSHNDGWQCPVPPADMLLGAGATRLSPQQRQLTRKYFYVDRGEEWRVLPLNEKQNSSAYSRWSSSIGPDPEVLGYFYQPWGAGNTNTFGYRSLATLRNDRPYVFDDSKEIAVRGAVPGNSAIAYTAQDGNYTIDFANGLVRFENPVYFQDDQEGWKPAPLRLRISHPMRDPVTHAKLCHQWWNTPQSPIATDVIDFVKRSDFSFEYCADRTKNNKASFLDAAKEFLNEQLAKYSISRGYSAPYRGFVVDMPPDGIVRSVTWDVRDGAGGITHIDFNMERPEAYLTFQEMQNARFANYQLWLAAQIAQKRKKGLLPP